MNNHLYIFRPHKGWDYCGGALIICANSLGRCQELIDEYTKSQSQEYEEKYILLYYDIKLSLETDHWVLHKTYALVGRFKEGIILNNWNYA